MIDRYDIIEAFDLAAARIPMAAGKRVIKRGAGKWDCDHPWALIQCTDRRLAVLLRKLDANADSSEAGN